MPYAKETLAKLKELGYQNIIYTHKGRSTIEILKKIEIASYFYDVITKENGFKRKPDPEGILYILNKYNIEKEEAIYIGDRPLDLLCAKNAGIKSILYSPKDSPIDFEHPHKIRDLKEIIE
jgi:HAD superfamily hydrolase (TIGR01549 family)